jgi:poly(3-hydroxybutyrate) depolymerase
MKSYSKIGFMMRDRQKFKFTFLRGYVMHRRAGIFATILFGFTVNAQTVNLQGVVSNSGGQPVGNAIVTLVRQAMKDTTGTDGKYSFGSTVAVQLPTIVLPTEVIVMNNGVLQFTLSNSSPVKVEIFDVKGNLLKKEEVKSAAAGVYRLNIAKNCRATGLFVIKAAIGKREVSFPYMTLNNGKYTLNQSGAYYASPTERGVALMAAVLDTLKVTANGFQTKTVVITSYENQQQNITLDTNVSNGKNPPCPSGGCGKDLSDLKSGTYKITSAGLERSYILNIPADYDKNTPYRMIFAMHCMGSSASQCAGSMKYYEMQTYAANAKVPVILVAPDGYTDDSPWRISDDKDHTFFGDMLKLFKEKLCVDTSRVFCCGFSYGAMVSYSLSLDFQSQLRAVATYAPANWNIWLPKTAPKAPIAYYQTTGTDDNLCKYVNSDAKKEGGKYCVLQHIEDNGCTAPATIPTTTGTTHLSTEFPGCKEGYPVIFGSFKGGHANTAKDPGSNVNWIAKETWDFFMRF